MQREKEEIGRRIKQALKEAHISQAAIADVLNISQSTVTAYVQGRNEPPLNSLKVIADRCNVSLDWLISGPEQQNGIVAKPSGKWESTPAGQEDGMLRLLVAEMEETWGTKTSDKDKLDLTEKLLAMLREEKKK